MKNLLFISFFLTSFCAIAQDDFNDYIKYKPTQPEATQIQKYGDYTPPNAYGVVPVNLPITQITSGNFTIPISLYYSAGSGIKVNDRSSVVGLGWNLSILDNYIEILVQGSGQDFGNNYDSYAEYQQIETRFQVNNIDSIWALNRELKSNALAINFSERDHVKDKMNYSFLGKSGSIVKDSSGNYEIISSSQDDLKVVEHAYNNLELIDGDGNHYFFNREIRYYPDSTIDDVKKRLYLTKIILYSGAEINFNYSNTDPNSDSYSNSSTMVTRMFQESVMNGGAELQISDFTPPLTQTNSSTVNATNNTLRDISFPGGKVVFGYSASGTFLLKNIKVFDKNNNLVENYNINNNSFFKNISAVNVAPKLEAIEKVASGSLASYNIYEFTYDANPIPLRLSTKGDYWGYNNNYETTVPDFKYFYGGQVYDFNGDNRKPVFTYTKAGILTEIIYPTQGKSRFLYEPNYYAVKKLVTSTSSPSIRNVNLTAIGQNPAVGSYTPIDSTSFFIDHNKIYGTGGITVTFTSSSFLQNGTQFPYYKITAPDGTVYTRAFYREEEKNSDTFYITNLPTGTYKAVAYVGDASLYPNDPQPSIFYTASLELSLSWQEYPQNDEPQFEDVLVQGGGVRVKKIENFTSGTGTSPAEVRTFEYGEKLINGVGVGDFLGLENQTSIISNVNADVSGANHILTNFLVVKDVEDRRWYPVGWGADRANYFGDGIQLSSEPVIPIEFKGNSVFYPKVVVYDSGSKSTLGYTEQFYIKPQRIEVRDVTGDFSTSSSAQVELTKYSDYSGSHLIKEIAFNSNHDTISLKIYNYQNQLIKEQPTFNINSSDKTLTISGMPIIAYPAEVAYMSKINLKYFYFKERIYQEKLVSTSQKFFFTNGKVQSSSAFEYLNNDSFRIIKKETKDSKGQNIVENFFFPDQVENANSLGLTVMSSSELNNYINLASPAVYRINEPVQVERTVRKADYTILSTQIRRTYYDYFHSKLHPSSIYSKKKEEPLQSRIEFTHYDYNGNYSSLKKSGGPSTVHIWGYDGQHLIAKIENATYSEVSGALGVTDLSSVNETNMAAIDLIRTNSSLLHAKVTTYTYDPLVGISSITDPKGYTTTYVYDEFNRLKFVKDEEGNILSENQYNYKLSSN